MLQYAVIPGRFACFCRASFKINRGWRGFQRPERSTRGAPHVSAVSWTLGVSAEVASPLRDRTERSSAARAFTLRVWLVLQQRGVRVSRLGRVTGIAVD